MTMYEFRFLAKGLEMVHYIRLESEEEVRTALKARFPNNEVLVGQVIVDAENIWKQIGATPKRYQRYD